MAPTSPVSNSNVTVSLNLINVTASMEQNRKDRCKQELYELAAKYRFRITTLEMERINDNQQ